MEKNNLEKGNLAEKSNLDKKKPLEKSRLGRGLSSLIPPSIKAPVLERPTRPENPTETLSESVPPPPPIPAAPELADLENGIHRLPIAKIAANIYQPRTEFDEAALSELADSIKVHGVLQPVMVRPKASGRYELIAGERRFRAAQLAGLKEIPAVVREMTDEESLTVALIENIQREDLNAMEAARGYKQLLDQFGLTQAELSRQIGKSQSTVAYALSLLRLSPEVQDSIADGRLSMEHGKVLLSVSAPERRRELWVAMLSQGFSLVEARRRAVEDYREASETVPRRSRVEAADDPEPESDVHLQAIEDRLRSVLGLKVTIRTGRTGRGVVTIDFSNVDELETIIDCIVNEK